MSAALKENLIYDPEEATNWNFDRRIFAQIYLFQPHVLYNIVCCIFEIKFLITLK